MIVAKIAYLDIFFDASVSLSSREVVYSFSWRSALDLDLESLVSSPTQHTIALPVPEII